MNKNKCLFNRYIKVIFTFRNKNEDYDFSLDTSFIDIEATVSLDTNLEKEDHSIYSNKANITFYNLPLKIKNELIEDTPLTIIAGYLDSEESQGIIYKGIIENVTENSDGTTTKTQIQCSEANDEFQKIKYIISVNKPNIKASEIIKSISENSKLEFEEPQFGNDIIYTRGRTYNGTLKQVIQSIAKDTDSHAFLSKRRIVFLAKENPVMDEIICDIEKIKSISEIDSGYTIDSIFDHRMEPNYKLSIKYDGDRFTKKLEGTYLITKVEHILSVDTGSFSTKIEILDELKLTQIKENSNMEKEIKIEI